MKVIAWFAVLNYMPSASISQSSIQFAVTPNVKDE